MSDERDGMPSITRAAARPVKRRLARAFRRQPTISEELAWDVLRDRQILGLKFRRQQIIGGFIVDFFCAELGLVIEIDGGSHEDEERRIADAQRTVALEKYGVVVVRIDAERVGSDTLHVLLSPFISPP